MIRLTLRPNVAERERLTAQQRHDALIARNGYAIRYVADLQGRPHPYAFTIGLTEHRRAELLVVGLDQAAAERVLRAAAHLHLERPVAAGDALIIPPPNPGGSCPDSVECWEPSRFRLLPVPEVISCCYRELAPLHDRYGPARFELGQLIWAAPSSSGWDGWNTWEYRPPVPAWPDPSEQPFPPASRPMR